MIFLSSLYSALPGSVTRGPNEKCSSFANLIDRKVLIGLSSKDQNFRLLIDIHLPCGVVEHSRRFSADGMYTSARVLPKFLCLYKSIFEQPSSTSGAASLERRPPVRNVSGTWVRTTINTINRGSLDSKEETRPSKAKFSRDAPKQWETPPLLTLSRRMRRLLLGDCDCDYTHKTNPIDSSPPPGSRLQKSANSMDPVCLER